MRFVETPLAGAYRIELTPHHDARGFFARSYCTDEFAAQGLVDRFVQCNVSFNHRKATLRGMHWQAAPHGEVKLVRCTAGAILDVIVDVRPESETFRRVYSLELSAENHRMLYIPEGFAHGFQTLEDRSEISYQMGSAYAPDAARGFRFDDPDVGIVWPFEPSEISQRDAMLPTLEAVCGRDEAGAPA